jgi:hypothetical protein
LLLCNENRIIYRGDERDRGEREKGAKVRYIQREREE